MNYCRRYWMKKRGIPLGEYEDPEIFHNMKIAG
jgi:hypothetical protein